MSSFGYFALVMLILFMLFFLVPAVKAIIRWFQSPTRFAPFSYPDLMGPARESRLPQTPMIGIRNPNERSVRVRVLSDDGDTQELLSIERNQFGHTSVRSGQYYIRYKFDDSQQVYEGERFFVDYGSAAMITLKYTPGGNYRSWPVKGPL